LAPAQLKAGRFCLQEARACSGLGPSPAEQPEGHPDDSIDLTANSSETLFAPKLQALSSATLKHGQKASNRVAPFVERESQGHLQHLDHPIDASTADRRSSTTMIIESFRAVLESHRISDSAWDEVVADQWESFRFLEPEDETGKGSERPPPPFDADRRLRRASRPIAVLFLLCSAATAVVQACCLLAGGITPANRCVSELSQAAASVGIGAENLTSTEGPGAEVEQVICIQR
jgi:hypothetical protein